MVTFLNLKSSLKTNEYPALCLYGTDRWLQLKALENICEAYGVVDDGFGVDRLESPKYDDVEYACCAPALFASKKIVVVSEFVFPQEKNPGQKNKQLAEILEKFGKLIAQNDGSYCLVFTAEKPAPYDKIEGLTLVNCERLDSESVAKWIVAYARRQGTEIPLPVARKIGEYCLYDMTRVSMETQKLLDHGEVTMDAVDELVHKDSEYSIFDLSSKISDKNASGAIALFDGLVSSGEKTASIFGLLYNTFRRAYYAKITDMTNEKLAEQFGVKPFAAGKAKELAAKYKPMQLKRILDLFAKADAKMKAFLDDNEVITDLIMQIVCI